MRYNPNNLYIIAEIGSNHGGNLDVAKLLIQKSAAVGADAVKFQLFKLEDVYRKPDEAQRIFELSPHWIPELSWYAHKYEVDFGCTPFAPWAIEVLKPHVDFWKIGSFEAGWDKFLDAVPKDDRPRFASTGKGFIATDFIPLVCTSQYPTEYKDTDLDLVKALQPNCGYSSHTRGWADCVAAIALGARVIEKHIQLSPFTALAQTNEYLNTPDSGPWSLTTGEFERMVCDLRGIWSALHTPNRWKLPSSPNRKVNGK